MSGSRSGMCLNVAKIPEQEREGSQEPAAQAVSGAGQLLLVLAL